VGRVTNQSPGPVSFDPGPAIYLDRSAPAIIVLTVLLWACVQYGMHLARAWRRMRDDDL
jgi:hypothetical protein